MVIWNILIINNQDCTTPTLTVALKPPVTTYNKTIDEMIHMLNSLETYPSVSIFTKKPVEPNNIASKGTATKKVTITEMIRIVSLL